jgi:hypothetical protein
LQANAVVEETNKSASDDTPDSGIDFYGSGIQLEGGLAGNIWNAYVGFRQEVSGHRNAGSYYHESNRWTSERFLLGARLHVSDEYPNPVKPLLGAAISYGWAQRRIETQDGWMAGEVTEESARGALGYLAEIGFLVKVQRPFYLSFLLRAERLNLKFGDQSHYGSINNVYEVAGHIGVHYQFQRRLW